MSEWERESDTWEEVQRENFSLWLRLPRISQLPGGLVTGKTPWLGIWTRNHSRVEDPLFNLRERWVFLLFFFFLQS